MGSTWGSPGTRSSCRSGEGLMRGWKPPWAASLLALLAFLMLVACGGGTPTCHTHDDCPEPAVCLWFLKNGKIIGRRCLLECAVNSECPEGETCENTAASVPGVGPEDRACVADGSLPCSVRLQHSDAFNEVCKPHEPDGGWCAISNCLGWGTNTPLECRCRRQPCGRSGVKACNTDAGTCYQFKDDCLPFDYEACPGFVGSALHALCYGEDFGGPDVDALDAGTSDAPDAADAGLQDAADAQ
jgi:hypothetical protein